MSLHFQDIFIAITRSKLEFKSHNLGIDCHAVDCFAEQSICLGRDMRPSKLLIRSWRQFFHVRPQSAENWASRPLCHT